VSHDKVATYLSSADVGVAPDPKNALNDNSSMI
jgi:glycosyltransferase involved in cell wall biosynthesis